MTRRLSRGAAALVAGLVALALLPASAQAEARVPVIVRFADGSDMAKAAVALPESRRIGPLALALETSTSALASLGRIPGAVGVDRDVRWQAAVVPNDPCLVLCVGMQQWNVFRIGAPRAWDFSRGRNVVIAVIDSGVAASHPDLAGKLVRAEIDTTGGAPADRQHGTAVAGVAAAATNNGQGIAGIGWEAGILSIRALDDQGGGFTSWIADGIYRATDNGAHVINLSLGGTQFSPAVADAVAYAVSAGVVVVAAVGNDGSGAVSYPAAHPGVIGVGASTREDRLASFSNRGTGLDLAAPGVEIPAPDSNGGYLQISGTSAAAPHVSGAAALLVSQGIDRRSVDVERRLVETTARTADGIARRLDIGRALPAVRPYGAFPGGVRVAAGDLDGNGSDSVVTGAGPGGGPHVRVFSPDLADRGSFFAYDQRFGGGVDVAVGDIDGNGRAEIITGAGPGGGPHVRVFSPTGTLLQQFFAYDSAFTGGISVATADIDGDGRAEIITGAGPGGGPHVRVFRPDGSVRHQFFAYDAAFRGGVDVGGGDIDGNGLDEIVTGAGPGGGPHVRVFRAGGALRHQFFAYTPGFTGGVRVSFGNVDGTIQDEIVTGAGPGGGPHVKWFTPTGGLVDQRFPVDAAFTGGIDVAGSAGGSALGTLSRDTLVRRFPVP